VCWRHKQTLTWIVNLAGNNRVVAHKRSTRGRNWHQQKREGRIERPGDEIAADKQSSGCWACTQAFNPDIKIQTQSIPRQSKHHSSHLISDSSSNRSCSPRIPIKLKSRHEYRNARCAIQFISKLTLTASVLRGCVWICLTRGWCGIISYMVVLWELGKPQLLI
jgi:hypothetical protein